MADCRNCHSRVEIETRHQPVKYGVCDVKDTLDNNKVLYRSYLGHSVKERKS